MKIPYTRKLIYSVRTIFNFPFIIEITSAVHILAFCPSFLRECSRKMKVGIGIRRKISLLIATNLTSICCVYREKIVKNYS